MRLMILAASAALATAGVASAQGYPYYQQPRQQQPTTPSYTPPSNDHTTSGYTRADGTYVQPYHAKNPNSTREDNYTTRGNTNPYTGQRGSRSPG